MYGEKLKHTGTTQFGRTWQEMVEDAQLEPDEFILVFNEEKRAFEMYDNHDLITYLEEEARKHQ